MAAPLETRKRRTTLRSFFSCKHYQTVIEGHKSMRLMSSMGWSGGLCNLRESSKVMQRPEPPDSPESWNTAGTASNSSRSLKSSSPSSSTATTAASLTHSSGSITATTSSSSLGGSFRGMQQLRRFSGCYECHMVAADPAAAAVPRVVPSLRTDVFTCCHCGELFAEPEGLELHQAVKHAVSELGPEDTSRNIVEIIFQSSWLKQAPVCLERILKVQNTEKTVTRFESYRDSIKNRVSKFAKKHARCAADGNELLRFYCTSIDCSVGLNRSTNLCLSSSNCNVCSIIRDGFKPHTLGWIRTMATSGGAHDGAEIKSDGKRRAMLVCRVIAGRVNKNQEGSEECDSVAGITGEYSNLDELIVFDPKSILPCFVVIYNSV